MLLRHSSLLFGLILSTNLFAQTYQGELEVLVADDLENKKSELIFQMHENNGKTHKLDIPAAIDKQKLKTGNKIVIQGQEEEKIAPGQNSLTKNKSEKVIKVRTIDVTKEAEANDQNSNTNTSQTSELVTTTTTDNRNILILLVNFTNMQATTTVPLAGLESMVFTAANSSAKSILLNSFNQVNFKRDSNGDGRADIYTVNLNYATTDCDYNRWVLDAKNAATKLGINISIYKHFMLVLPKNIYCSWAGLGTVGCGTTCTTWVRGYEPSTYTTQIYTHELGHNLGMRHAGLDQNNDGVFESEYGDISSFMGGPGTNVTYPQANAANRDLLGWFNKYPTLVAYVGSTGQYTILPLDQGISNTRVKVLKLKRNATDTYYISLRKSSAPFNLDSTYDNRVHIHVGKVGDARSFLIKKLMKGEIFTDATINKNIRVDFIAPDGSYAVVSIY